VFSLFAILAVAALRLRLRNRCGLGLNQNPPFLDGHDLGIAGVCPHGPATSTDWKGTPMGLTWIIAAVVAVVAMVGVFLYNKLVRLRNTVRSAWSDIDVHLKKRFDLVPNLVEVVKGYAAHEQSLFTKVAEARAQAIRATGPAETAQAENMLRDSLKSLFAVAEAYPELKANQNFLQLQTQLKEIEDNIEAARRYYNAVVRDFNTTIEQFPSNLIASQFRFEQNEFFELESPDVERKPVRVGF
jgi:LemA protein